MIARCEGCGREVVVSAEHPLPFACPDARPGDDIDHLLVTPSARRAGKGDATFARFRSALAFGRLGIDDAELLGIIETLDEAVAEVCGTGFRVTPTVEVDGLTVKDETGNVGGTHKGRHLMGIALWLACVERLGWVERGRLAIASCGNAALAAGIIAKASGRALDAYVPVDASSAVVARLEALGVEVHRCPRRPGEAGDPTWHRFTEAVLAGALPFCCQGPANGLTLDGGRTLAWELGDRAFDDVVIQVGGGALASSLVRGLAGNPRIHVVQTEAVAPLQRAIRLVREHGGDLSEAMTWARTHRSSVMWPWDSGESVAGGILDEETYDWARLVQAVIETGGEAVTVGEDILLAARDELERITGIDASPTGASGFAGLVELRRTGRISGGARVLVVASGGPGT